MSFLEEKTAMCDALCNCMVIRSIFEESWGGIQNSGGLAFHEVDFPIAAPLEGCINMGGHAWITVHDSARVVLHQTAIYKLPIQFTLKSQRMFRRIFSSINLSLVFEWKKSLLNSSSYSKNPEPQLPGVLSKGTKAITLWLRLSLRTDLEEIRRTTWLEVERRVKVARQPWPVFTDQTWILTIVTKTDQLPIIITWSR